MPPGRLPGRRWPVSVRHCDCGPSAVHCYRRRCLHQSWRRIPPGLGLQEPLYSPTFKAASPVECWGPSAHYYCRSATQEKGCPNWLVNHVSLSLVLVLRPGATHNVSPTASCHQSSEIHDSTTGGKLTLRNTGNKIPATSDHRVSFSLVSCCTGSPTSRTS